MRWVPPPGQPTDHVLGGRLGALRGDQTVVAFTVQPNRDDLTVLADLLATGALRPHLDRVVGVDGVVTAIEGVESGHTRGKVVVRMHPAKVDGPATIGAASSIATP